MADRRDEKRLVEKRLDPDVDFEIIEILKIVIFFQKNFQFTCAIDWLLPVLWLLRRDELDRFF